MPDGSNVAYNAETHSEYGEKCAKTWIYDKKQNYLNLSGPCPKCEHASTFQWPLKIVMSALPDSAADEGERVPIQCECLVQHDSSGGKRGCGAYWYVVVD